MSTIWLCETHDMISSIISLSYPIFIQFFIILCLYHIWCTKQALKKQN